MILTQFLINSRRQGARKLLSSPQAMHAAVLAGFPPTTDPGRVLWRLDGVGTSKTVLWVVASAAPDFTHLEEQAGWPSQPTTRTVDYQPFVDSLAKGQQWAFRLTANPTHRASVDGRKRILGHVTVEQQTQWLLGKAESIGASLEESGPTFSVVGRDLKKFRRQNSTVTLTTVTYAGTLTVTDPTRLQAALTAGIGRAKGYGCGLLTLARP